MCESHSGSNLYGAEWRVADTVGGVAEGLRIDEGLEIPMGEIELRASRSSGPGGQHANVTASRVEAVFDVRASGRWTIRSGGGCWSGSARSSRPWPRTREARPATASWRWSAWRRRSRRPWWCRGGGGRPGPAAPPASAGWSASARSASASEHAAGPRRRATDWQTEGRWRSASRSGRARRLRRSTTATTRATCSPCGSR